MPATIILSKTEADFLRSEGVQGVEGYSFTYAVGDTGSILASVDKAHETYPKLAQRLASVASQLGVPDVMFAKPKPAAKTKSKPAATPSPEDAAQEPAHTVESASFEVEASEHSEPAE